ncbi:hypothetical protein [Candidatus Electronema sp. PJ]|uniref:hypothetical protein n=1 Tax=Candidatus Electronema sp. PJ TaxID=3401572 RepID=UPI003AA8B7DE
MEEKLRSADVLVKTIMETPGVLDEFRDHPEEVLKKMLAQTKQNLSPRALEQDKCIYRTVVGFLGAIALFSVLGAIYLESDVPDVVTALGSAAIGALAGILSPMPQRS